MPLTPRKSAELFVEPLEARIAPTGLVAITNPDPTSSAGKGDPTYIDYTTLPTAGKLGFVPGSTYGVAGADIYAIKLTGNGTIGGDNLNTGDKLVIFNSVEGFNFASPFIQATNASLVAFFRDSNGDHLVQNSELVGISMSKGAGVNVNGTVDGDIVSNLPADGTPAFSATLKLKQNLNNITIVGDVNGSILAGGTISNVQINGNIGGIFSGTAANGQPFHFGDAGVTTGTVVAKAPRIDKAGPSITGLTVVSVTDQIHAGNGGLHGDGGAIDGLQILNDSNGFSLVSGSGGDGNALGRAGAGGTIHNVTVRGVPEAAQPDGSLIVGLISIATGTGGNNADLRGGKGGAVNGVAIGYDVFDADTLTSLQSLDFLNERVLIQGGQGGVGRRGGIGGAVNGVLVATNAVDDGNITQAETQILSGDGGLSTIPGTGRGGRGGSINQITAENLLLPAAGFAQGSILVQSGNGAAAAKGGDINAVTLLGTRLTIEAGDGADGFIHGGAGGTIDTVNILSAPGIFAADVIINAGTGGIGSRGPGGNGGNVTAFQMLDSHLTSFVINSGTNGNGGDSASGAGGFGGTVTNLIINDTGDFLAQGAPVSIRTGNGGSGATGGGAGGDLSAVQIIGTDIAYTVSAGNGGNVTGGGLGDAGNGGVISQVGISNQPVAVSVEVSVAGSTLITQISSANTATVTSGNGGTAAAGLGGTGGDITGLSVTSFINVTPQPDLNAFPANFQADNFAIVAGSGAAGGTAAGKGGDIAASGAFSAFGSITARTGNGGQAGGAPADGGVMDGFVAAALGQINLLTGNGGVGGSGGSITNSGTNLVPISTLLPDPNTGQLVNLVSMTNNRGGLTVQAGNGSVGNGVGGSGGSITNFSGFISAQSSPNATDLTLFKAGNGGGGDFKRSGAGGSIDQIKLTGVNDGTLDHVGSVVAIDAGDAGVSGRVKNGRDGGSATNITIYEVDPGTVVHHISAGDAGSGRLTGGNGGSVTDVHVGLTTETVDIGVRSGLARGYNLGQAGGIFAGLGGSGGNAIGVSGSVTNITASAIASIVAGKGVGFGLVNTVDQIFLNGLTPSAANADRSYINFDAANLVGSVVDPLAPDATVFDAATSGLIAALTLTETRNFVPEAYETLDATGQLVVFDLQQPGNPVITPVG